MLNRGDIIRAEDTEYMIVDNDFVNEIFSVQLRDTPHTFSKLTYQMVQEIIK